MFYSVLDFFAFMTANGWIYTITISIKFITISTGESFPQRTFKVRAYFHNLNKSTSTNIQRLSSLVWCPLVQLGPFIQTGFGERISSVATFCLIWHLTVGTAVRLLLMLFQSVWVVEHIQQAKAQSSYIYWSQSRWFRMIRVINANKIRLKEKRFTAWNHPQCYNDASLKLVSKRMLQSAVKG